MDRPAGVAAARPHQASGEVCVSCRCSGARAARSLHGRLGEHQAMSPEIAGLAYSWDGENDPAVPGLRRAGRALRLDAPALRTGGSAATSTGSRLGGAGMAELRVAPRLTPR